MPVYWIVSSQPLPRINKQNCSVIFQGYLTNNDRIDLLSLPLTMKTPNLYLHFYMTLSRHYLKVDPETLFLSELELMTMYRQDDLFLHTGYGYLRFHPGLENLI